MNIPFEDLKLKFGAHRGKALKDVPEDYLRFLVSKSILKGKALYHCQVRFNLPKKTWRVTVKYSVDTDGVYTVQAYNRSHAAQVCCKQYNIQNTQSQHGTSYSAVEICDEINL